MRYDNDIVTPRVDNGSLPLFNMLMYFVTVERETDLLRRHCRFELERVSQVTKGVSEPTEWLTVAFFTWSCRFPFHVFAQFVRCSFQDILTVQSDTFEGLTG